MKKKCNYSFKHIIVETSKEDKEIHLKQAITALLKMNNEDENFLSKKDTSVLKVP